MKQQLLLGLLLLVGIASCTKDKPEELSIKGKWTLENAVMREFDNNTLVHTETMPGNGTTIDFQDNGTVVITTQANGVETHPYTIMPDSKVSFDGDVYEIRNLTKSGVVLFLRVDHWPGTYEEVTASLRR
jgi:hypothetical protein